MKHLTLTSFLIIIISIACRAQKIDVNEWAKHIVDSLEKSNVDTIESYHEYCGECEGLMRPPADTDRHHNCQIKGSWEEINNVIIYKQSGKYYSLSFDCYYPPIKKSLNKVESLDYFISIIPFLNKRDHILRERQKKHFFPEMVIVDGDYEQATLYFSGMKKIVFLHDDDLQKIKPFWLKYELELVKKIESDINPKPPTAH